MFTLNLKSIYCMCAYMPHLAQTVILKYDQIRPLQKSVSKCWHSLAMAIGWPNDLRPSVSTQCGADCWFESRRKDIFSF